MSRRIDIIGAGASGMACAWYLAQKRADLEIHVWDRDLHAGGLAGSFETEDFRVEKFYHHIFKRDEAIQQLIREVGLEHELVWKPAATGSYYFSQPYRLSSPLDVLRFSPLPFWDRLRLGGMVLHARMVRNWESLDDETVKEYICRVAGQKVYEIVWEPLLKGKFGQYADQVSAAWLWSKLVDRGGSRNRQGHELLGYLKGGMGRLFSEIATRLESSGHVIHLGTGVDMLEENARRITHIHTSEGTFPTDAVIATTQLPDFVNILPPSLRDYSKQLRRIKFLGNVCLVLQLNTSLSEFYWTNITDPDSPFVGIVEQTNWAGMEEFGNKPLVYISAYAPPEDRRFRMDENSLTDYYLPYIQKIFPDFSADSILRSWLWKADYAQPVVSVGYRKLIPSVQTPLDNLYLSTMAQIYPNDRQVSNGIAKARDLIDRII